MILVSMCDHKRFDLVEILLQKRRIRDHKIDAEHVVLGERQSAVHYHNAVAVYESSDIHTDLFKSPQRNDLEGLLRFLVCLY